MRIERIEVEEGFLDGLEVSFVPGLNVLIGERGTGKTSVLELLRYCTGAPWFTEEARTRGHQQALAVLGDGQVRVTIDDGGERTVLTRTAADDRPGRQYSSWTVVLAQNEIEAVGAQPAGRLRLIDRFRSDTTPEDQAPTVLARLKSLTAEIQATIREIAVIDERAAVLADVDHELDEALAEQADILLSAAATDDQRAQLDQLQKLRERLSARASVFGSASTRLLDYIDRVQELVDRGVQVDPWPASAGEQDLLASVRNDLSDISSSIESVFHSLVRVAGSIDLLGASNAAEQAAVEEQARILRLALERLQQGVGAVTRRVGELRERKGQLDALRESREKRLSHLAELREARAGAYDTLDELRDRRFQQRVAIATNLNKQLGPHIRVAMTRSASTTVYAQQLINALRGSGIHYNSLAPHIARELSPYEIVTSAESLDVGLLQRVLGLPQDRAAALLRYLQASNLPDLVVAPIDDGVTLELLDGKDYKASDQLSIGQRCTVVLPILLASHGGTLIVDQPEDHLDNAFVTQTLVGQLRNRQAEDQLIFSSHNPNIPVLGEADQVIVLGSNGRRAFKVYQGPLEDPAIVANVSALMEGGAEAFRRRAEFYGRSLKP